MQRSAIRTQVQLLLNDPDGIVYSSTIVNAWIDLGLVDAMARLGTDISVQTIAITGSDTFALSQPNYQLDDTTDNIREVYLADQDDEEQRIYVYDQDELNNIFGRGWRETTEVGSPSVGYRVDRNVLGLHQRPNAAHNGNTLRVFYGRSASDLGGDTSIPALIKANHDALTMYCISRGWDKLGNTDKSSYYLKRYETMLARFQNKEQRFSDDMNAFRWG